MEETRRLPPSAVEIDSSQVTPEVAVDDSINIDHGIDLEDIVVQKISDFRCILEQSTHDTLCYIR